MKKRRSDFVIAGCFLLFFLSCGIEEYAALPAPIIPLQTDYNTISFQHDPSLYSSDSNFQGYEIYYRIYASLGFNTQNLNDDNDWLIQNGATLDRLIQRGYKRLNLLYLEKNPEPLLDLINDGNTPGPITLDFINFNNQNATNTINFVNLPADYISNNWDPFLTLPSGKNFILFRGVLDNNKYYKKFEYLYQSISSFSRDDDMSPGITQATAQYQICFFISSFAWSLERTTYSMPVPLGVIGPINATNS